MVKPKLDQDYIDLMPQNQEVTPLASPDPEVDQVPSNQGDTEILDDNPKVEMQNISFDDSQHRVVQSHRVPTLDVHIYLVHFEERVTISNVLKNPTTFSNATRAYVKATNSTV